MHRNFVADRGVYSGGRERVPARRIRELKLLSGNPLLAPSVLEAVRQWIYEPTLLNGEPVELIATISVIFRLN
jgi:hypothetical protein